MNRKSPRIRGRHWHAIWRLWPYAPGSRRCCSSGTHLQAIGRREGLIYLHNGELRMQTSVTEWLLDSDPSIRWQVMRDLIGEADAAVARERSRIAVEGWGARLLDLQGPDGCWGGAAFVPRAWISTFDTLQLLRDLGVDPASDRVQRAIENVREGCTWGG